MAALCVSPDGKTLFSGAWDEVIIWNWQTGEIIKTFKVNSKHYCKFNWIDILTISLDDRFLAGMSLKTIKVWDLETKQEIYSFNNEDNSFTTSVRMDKP
ncbi:WD40 repeat domain-containing protein [Calothrix sp. NIES-2100]|uniref:WD40 repeat domain-containing protein n=1 Tax=Calothrix sp. NIES-2100 TaxID=1954172 RepID=UPI00403FAD45